MLTLPRKRWDFGPRSTVVGCLLLLEHFSDDSGQLFQSKRLDQDSQQRILIYVLNRLEDARRGSRHEEHLQGGAKFPRSTRKFQTPHTWHLNIAQHQVNLAVPVTKSRQSGFSAVRFQYLKALTNEESRPRTSKTVVIIDEQDRGWVFEHSLQNVINHKR